LIGANKITDDRICRIQVSAVVSLLDAALGDVLETFWYRAAGSCSYDGQTSMETSGKIVRYQNVALKCNQKRMNIYIAPAALRQSQQSIDSEGT
jgi:hypothetical protein